MKKKIAPDEATDIVFMNTIISASRRPRRPHLLAAHQRATAAYASYEDALTSTGQLVPVTMTDEEHDAYFDLYDSEAVNVIAAKTEVARLFGIDYCPYCRIEPTLPLDHFLPRSKFPEFSISTRNLVPSCTTCNTVHKKARWGIGPNRPFLHPYFDAFPAILYLRCMVQVQPATPNAPGSLIVGFTIDKTGCTTSQLLEQVDQIERHFTEMDLNTRYINKVTMEILPALGRLLASQANQAEREENVNHYIHSGINSSDLNTWEKAFFTALAPLAAILSAGNWP